MGGSPGRLSEGAAERKRPHNVNTVISKPTMPNTKSAEKRLRQNKKRRLHNKTIKSSLKTQLRKVREAVAGDDLNASENAFQALVKNLDRAAAKKVIHPNAAARLKSRLSSKLKAAKTNA